MAGFTSREVRLKARPVGVPQGSDFEIAAVELGAPGDGQVLVRNSWMSVDPYMRGRMYDRASYVPPFQIGEALQGGAIGTVVESKDANFQPGDTVMSMMGWREGFVAPGGTLEKLPVSNVPVEAYLGVLGMPGLTAYAGLLEIGQPKPGETVFVSGGAGAVGSLVAQIAKIKGCTVVATAGTDAKCDWLRSVGVDHAINYKTCGNLLAAVRAAAPKGIDVYFDNVGGEHLEVAIETARPLARFAECGMISAYNDTVPTPGPQNMVQIVGKGLTIRGFIVIQFGHLKPQFIAEMTGWIQGGQIKSEETVKHGIDNAASAFVALFSGGNTGKMLVKL